MSEPIKLPNLPRPPIHLSGWTNELCEWAKDYARLAVEQNTEALRAEVAALQSQVNAFYLGTPESRLLAMTKERDALRSELERLTTPDWREEAGRWLRRKADDAEPAAAATGYGNPAWWRPGLLRSAAAELDLEMAAAPFGLEAWQTPLPDVKEAKE